MREIELGATYDDQITGFAGIATAYCEYISGCHQVLLIPRVGTDGKRPAGEWFDVQRLRRTPGSVTVVLDNGATPGADAPAPVR